MPCGSGGYCNHSSFYEKIDYLTQNLCYLCGTLKEKQLFDSIANERIKKWFYEHTKDDEKRVVREMENYYRANPNKSSEPDIVALEFIAIAEKVHPVSEWHKKWFIDLSKKLSSIGSNIIEKQVIRQKAIKKLTDKEKQALDIK